MGFEPVTSDASTELYQLSKQANWELVIMLFNDDKQVT